MPITALPTPPSTSDPANFDERADAFLGALPQFQAEANALQVDVTAKEASVVAQVAAANAEALPNAAANAAATAADRVQTGLDRTAAAGSAATAITKAAEALASANAAAAIQGIPTVAGNARKVLRVNAGATGIEWADGDSMPRVARTANVMIGVADRNRWVDITAGTFTQTVDTPANIGPDWSCYLGNSGDGDVTIDPVGATTIDGLASFVMYPGELRLLHSDGVALRSIVINGFRKAFAASADFIKPPGYRKFGYHLAAGGKSGNAQVSSTPNELYGGGGGGGYAGEVDAVVVPATSPVVVGAGGAPAVSTGSLVAGNAGGSTTWLGIEVFGGGIATTGANMGGPALSPDSTLGFLPINPNSTRTVSPFAGGSPPTSSNAASFPAQHSLYGGGSASYRASGAAGVANPSIGQGLLLGSTAGVGAQGASPQTGATGGVACGGGYAVVIAASGTATSGAGGRGEARIWGLI